MDVPEIASLATSMSQARTADAIQVAVMRKAMDINAQGGLQLIQAASNAAPRNPAHLGNRIDIYA